MTDKKNTDRRVSTTQSLANLPSLDQIRQGAPQKRPLDSPNQEAKHTPHPQAKAQQETFSKEAARVCLEEILGHRLHGYKK